MGEFQHPGSLMKGEDVVSQETVDGTISTLFREGVGRPQRIEIVGRIWWRSLPSSDYIL